MVSESARPSQDRFESLRAQAGIAAIMFVAFGALAQITFEISESGVPAFFPAAGLSLGVLMILPRSRWPAALIGVAAAEIVGDLIRGINPWMAVVLAAANVLEPLIAAALLLSIRGRPWSPLSVQYMVAAMAASCAVSAIAGASVIVMSGSMTWTAGYASWWAGDFVGQLVVAPAIVAFAPRGSVTVHFRRRRIEWIGVTIGVGLLGLAELQSNRGGSSLLILPIVLLAASRLGVRGVAWCGLILGVLSVTAGLVPGGTTDALDVLSVGSMSGLATLITITLISAHLVAAEAHQRARAETTLRVSEQRARALIDQSPVATVEVRIDDGIVESWNSAAERLFGWSESEVIGKPNPTVPAEDRPIQLVLLASLRDATDYVSIEGTRRSKDGNLLHLMIGASPMRNQFGIADRVVATFIDIGAHKQREQDLAERARRDPLTGLPNRAALIQHLTDAHDRSVETGSGYCVLFCDLDGFKDVNDRFGHAVGDAVLIEIAQRLTDTTRQTDVVGRLGGDEFIVIIGRLDTERTPRELADRISTAVGRPLVVAGQSISIGISVGAAWSLEFQDPEALLAAADRSMYESKRQAQAAVRPD